MLVPPLQGESGRWLVAQVPRLRAAGEAARSSATEPLEWMKATEPGTPLDGDRRDIQPGRLEPGPGRPETGDSFAIGKKIETARWEATSVPRLRQTYPPKELVRAY